MNITEAIRGRRSIRKFIDKDIDREILEKVLEAGIRAPSAKNRQPWKFIVINGAGRAEMVKAMRTGIENAKTGGGSLPNYRDFVQGAEYTLEIMEKAPVTVFVLNTEDKLRLTGNIKQTLEEKLFEMANIQSIGAAIENMSLAALEYGLGSLWICDIYFAYGELAAWLNTEQEIIAAVSFGYPGEEPAPRPRKGMELVVEYR